jgi:hypothetical protein
MVRTQIQLTDKQAKALKKLASSCQLSMAELIRQGVDAILLSPVGLNVEEKQKRALAAAGRYRSGKRGVSREHDKHLAEAFGK